MWLGAQFKRIAAIQGDIVFHGPRRFFLKYRASKQKSWAFCMSNFAQLEFSVIKSPSPVVHKRGKDMPFIGAVSFTTNPSPTKTYDVSTYH
jgi:hypothetical protein